MSRPLKLLLIASHPVQYASPVFRLLAKDPRVEIQVAYCSMQGAEAHLDPDFGVKVKWDVPLLNGYPWIELPNRGNGDRGGFFRLLNPKVWSLIRSNQFDAVILYTGYVCATFWIALLAAKLSGISILFGTDAHELSPRDKKSWKLGVKKVLWPRLFGLADVVIVPSSGGVALTKSLGIPEERIALTPYTVDNDWWISQAEKSNREAVRNRWKIQQDAMVFVFSAKLQQWKRPLDLLRAFAAAVQAGASDAYLVFAGDGPLRETLEREVQSLGVASRVRFLGFVNQSGLPEVYAASDVLVLPSEYEPFGVVVNEAMLCGCGVVVSDRVGARLDLVREGETGFVFRAGDVEGLARILGQLATDSALVARVGAGARGHMAKWSPALNVDCTIGAVAKALHGRAEAVSDARAAL